MSDPYANDGATDPVSPSATGVYVEGSTTYPSTIDSGVTGLYAKYSYDAGCAAASLLPIVLLFHGYAGDADSLLSTDLRRWAARGFFCASLGLRGRNGATGARDASGRELYDAIDALAHLRATFPAVVSATMAGAVGWSGGGGNVLGLRCKTDVFTVSADFFGISDYGLDTTYGWYNFGVSLGSQTLLQTDIGGTPAAVPLAYQARDARSALAQALALGGWLHLLHDTGDTSVSVHASQQVVAALLAAGLTNYTYTETTGASSPRALHGHPTDHPADLPPLEQIFARRMRDSSVLALPTTGSLLVLGYYVSKTRDFEVWVGDAANPRTNGTGGRNRRALLVYDVAASAFRVTPLDGPSYLYFRHGLYTAASVLTPGRTLIVDSAAGHIDEIDNDLDGAPIGWAGAARVAWRGTPSPAWSGSRPLAWHGADLRTRTRLA